MREGRMDAFIRRLYAAVMAIIAIVVVFVYDRVEFYGKGYGGGFALSNVKLALIAGVLAAAAFVFIKRQNTATCAPRNEKTPVLLLLVPPALLFAAQLFIGYHIYAIQSGDVRKLLETGFFLARGDWQWIETYYFEIYPNNIPLTACFSWVLDLFLSAGIEPSFERYVAVLMGIQCCIGFAASVALMDLSWRLLRCKCACLLVFLVYVCSVGLTPYFASPYSDGMALAFPLIIAALDLHSRKRQASGLRRVLLGAAIGLFGGMALMIKPQSSVMFIAVVMYDLGAWLLGGFRNGKRILPKAAAMLCVFALMIGPVQSGIRASTGLGGDGEKRVGVLHYLYMGLDWATCGSYAAWDRVEPEEIPSYAARNVRYLEMLDSRWGDLNVVKFFQHFGRKLLVNFSDGTFAWGDGYQALPEKHSVISPVLRSFFWPDGGNRILMSTFQQVFWLMTIMLCPLAAFAVKRYSNNAERASYSVLMLGTLGIVAFNMLFEARSRYLYVMAPVMVLLAVSALALLAGRKRE